MPGKKNDLLFEDGAAAFLPGSESLPALARAAQACTACDLYKRATQAVMGEGPQGAWAFFIGEQPGDQEDLAGRPFVGPAGKVFDEALAAAEIPREEVYVTNTVKHFKWEARGKRRIHQKPNAGEIRACRPWLEAELAVVQPQVIVCLGGTAAQSLATPGTAASSSTAPGRRSRRPSTPRRFSACRRRRCARRRGSS